MIKFTLMIKNEKQRLQRYCFTLWQNCLGVLIVILLQECLGTLQNKNHQTCVVSKSLNQVNGKQGKRC